MNHPGQLELIEYTGGGTVPARSAEIAEHVAGCEPCRNICASIRTLDSVLRGLPVDRPSPAFTRNLLNRLGLRESNPLWWMFLKNLAPVFSVGVVAAVIFTLGSATSGGSGPSAGTSLFDAGPVAESFRGGLKAFTTWSAETAERYLLSAVGRDAIPQIAFLTLFLAGIGLLDRYVLGPLIRRRH